MADPLYIAVDVETAGSSLGMHSTLSLGACVFGPELLSFEDYQNLGLVFYRELKPDSLYYEIEAMRVGCSQLMCLEEIKKSSKIFDTSSPDFEPLIVLRSMEDSCVRIDAALKEFYSWLQGKWPGREVVGVTDTVFFDSGRINLLFGGHFPGPSPFGHGGIDLKSMYRGYTGRRSAKLKELGIPDPRSKPHRADQDATYLAMMGQFLMFEKMKP